MATQEYIQLTISSLFLDDMNMEMIVSLLFFANTIGSGVSNTYTFYKVCLLYFE